MSILNKEGLGFPNQFPSLAKLQLDREAVKSSFFVKTAPVVVKNNILGVKLLRKKFKFLNVKKGPKKS